MSSMQGKTVLVTGSSRGIGLYTALGLARMGAQVIVVSHNEAHSQNAVKEINAYTGRDAARYYVANLASQVSIHELASQMKRDYDHLDVLINNVGGWYKDYRESPDGIEMTFALNHLSYFLLTGLLLDLLKKSAPARIVNVSSGAHVQAKGINFENVGFEGKFSAIKSYAQSKLANILFTHALARRLEGTGVTVNALHPGFVVSELYRNFGILTPLVLGLAKLIGKDAEEGAQTSIYLASAPEVTEVTGKYFSESEPLPSSKASYDEDAEERLWQMSERLTGFTYPE